MTDNVGDPEDATGTGYDLEARVDISDSEFGVNGDCADSSISVVGVKPEKNSIFLNMGKTVISVGN